MTIYILRHGETEFNRLGIVQGSGVDTDLNELGREQADAFYEHFKDIDFDLVVTSALKRTHQTVARFIEKGLPWIATADINEICWGEQEGKRGTPEQIAVYQRTVAAWQAEDYEACMPGGESARELGERLQRFVGWLHTRPANTLLVCTHGRTMRALVTLLKGLPLSAMEGVSHANTGCYVIRLQEDGFAFELENSTLHLDNSPIPNNQ